MDDERKHRVVSHDARDVRAAISSTLERFAEWREQFAVMDARVTRTLTTDERASMVERCTNIERGIQSARVDMLQKLMHAPSSVAGHSKVADVEKALDNLSSAVFALKRAMRVQYH